MRFYKKNPPNDNGTCWLWMEASIPVPLKISDAKNTLVSHKCKYWFACWPKCTYSNPFPCPTNYFSLYIASISTLGLSHPNIWHSYHGPGSVEGERESVITGNNQETSNKPTLPLSCLHYHHSKRLQSITCPTVIKRTFVYLPPPLLSRLEL